MVKDKVSGEERVLPINYGTVVIFSTETNGPFYQKIVLVKEATGNQWYGLTFRRAKSYMDLSDEKPLLVVSKTRTPLPSCFRRHKTTGLFQAWFSRKQEQGLLLVTH